MIIDAFVLSVLIGLIRKGSFRGLNQIPIKYFYLFVCPLLLFGVICTIAGTKPSHTMLTYVRVANVVQYVLLLTAMGLNYHIREVLLAGVGTFFNFLAVASNGGAMPMGADTLRLAGLGQWLSPEYTSRFIRHCIMTPETHFKVFSDIIPVSPRLYASELQMLFERLHVSWIAQPFGRLAEMLASWGPSMWFKEVASIGDILITVAVFLIVQRYMCMRPAVVKETAN